MVELSTETVFTWGAPPIKFGAGAVDELGWDLQQLGVQRVLLITDARVAATGEWGGFVAVGGGSCIDTAKAVNLLTTYPGDVMEYVNAPVGQGKNPPGPLKPLVAVPTTPGPGAERS